MILAHTSESIVQIRLPASIDQTSRLDVVVQIRDRFGCATEIHLPSVYVLFDVVSISKFIDSLEESNNNSNIDPIFQLLISGDQNIVGQMIISISQGLQERNDKAIRNAA